ncbi:MAG: MFS transporter [bacterium]|nr:MFS transporter [bacterium]
MRSRSSHHLKFVFAAVLILSFHYAFTVYINSTFLSQFFTEKEVGYLYTGGALLTLLGFVASSSLIKRVGNVSFFTTGIIIEIIALFGLFYTSNPLHLKFFFILHQALPSLLLFSMDLFLEGASRTAHGNNTGRIRSTYLTILNISFVLSPMIVGNIVSVFTYRGVYLLSAMCCVALLFLIVDSLRHIPSHTMREVNFADSVRKYIPHKDLNRLFIINFLLQIFYAVMVIYTPIYLSQHIGFSWEAIGLIFTVMLVPFVLFEAPLGRMFDKIHTEKDTLIAGFLIIALSTGLIFLIQKPSVIIWMIALFATRVGASFVEVASDYSFFRRVSDRDAGFISVFRMASPLSYIIAPLLVAPIVHLLSIKYVFLLLGIIMLSGIIFSFKLRTLK